ncbi:MAG: hypothetical protein ACYSUV_12620, partial [Planctomycetota bacterium]
MNKKKAMLIMLCVLGTGLLSVRASQAQGRASSAELEMVKIKPGTFTMGADLSADYITAKRGIFMQDEFPARQVT